MVLVICVVFYLVSLADGIVISGFIAYTQMFLFLGVMSDHGIQIDHAAAFGVDQGSDEPPELRLLEQEENHADNDVSVEPPKLQIRDAVVESLRRKLTSLLGA